MPLSFPSRVRFRHRQPILSDMHFPKFSAFICLASLTSASVVTTGASGGVYQSGERPIRQNIATFASSGPAFDLFILSLQQFQQQDQSNLLSYYQVTGIHGRPFVTWDGAAGAYSAGYCTHNSILFPMWHRPYLALFEQILWNNAQAIATSYPSSTRSRYKSAATTFRMPYWDWAANATMPDIISRPTININTPSGLLVVANPLYKYTFHPQPSASDFPPTKPMSKYRSTVRYPDAQGNSQPALVNAQLQSNAAALRDLTYSLLTQTLDYARFSNTGYRDSQGYQYNSIENMHNAIHMIVGNGGHLSDIPFSAFDPVFWLHHTNVDRLIALWQALWPSSFLSTSQVSQYGTRTTAPGTSENVSSPLTPFRDSSGAFYTSTTARSTRPFGYTYPELIDWNVTAVELTSSIKANINSLYGSPSSNSISSRSPHSDVMNDNNEDRSRTSSLDSSVQGTDGIQRHKYSINIRVRASVLTSSFFIHFFLGQPPGNPRSWATASNLVASQSVLQRPSTGDNQSDLSKAAFIYGEVPLTHSLKQYQGDIRTFHDEPWSRNGASVRWKQPRHPSTRDKSNKHTGIASYLASKLTYRVQMLGSPDSNVGISEVGALELFVVGREVVQEATNGETASHAKLQELGHPEVVLEMIPGDTQSRNTSLAL